MHFKKIRQSHKGRELPHWTRVELYKKRKAEIVLERSHAAELIAAKAEGRCQALVMPTNAKSTPYRTIPATEGHVCCAPVFMRGYCRKHFNSHVLYVRDLQSARAGRGRTRRPFLASELPVGRMSDVQLDLMSDLERLPIATPLEECLAILTEADPSHPLTPIQKQPGSRAKLRD